jgi:peptidoglycan/LPS O-acetylase OafA/YrhL
MQPVDKKHERFSELDALRGFAALAVVVFHYTGHLHEFAGFDWFFEPGQHGVQLFFCISGFVIFWTLRRSSTLTDFVVSRFSRLYPVYWASLALWGAYVALTEQFWPRWFLVNATMLQKFVGMKDIDVVYWTLAVELVFYVWMAVLFAAGQLERVLWIVTAWLGVALVTSITGSNALLDTYLILPHIPYFAAGIVFYLARSNGWRRPYVGVLALAYAIVCLRGEIDFIVTASIVFAMFALAVRGSLAWLVNPATVWLGTISYALYVTHRNGGHVLLNYLTGRLHVSPWAALVVTIGAALSLASAITVYIERPAIKAIRSRYERFRERGATARSTVRTT